MSGAERQAIARELSLRADRAESLSRRVSFLHGRHAGAIAQNIGQVGALDFHLRRTVTLLNRSVRVTIAARRYRERAIRVLCGCQP